MARRRRGVLRHDGVRLPELLLIARSEHRARTYVDGLHDRGADALDCAPDRTDAARAAQAPRRFAARATRPQRLAAITIGEDRVEHRLRQLVSRRAGPKLRPVARFHFRILAS